MKFRKLKPKVGDVITISDEMSLRYEMIAEDLPPIWHEIPRAVQNLEPEEGNYLKVTTDLWFVFENGRWRVMNADEHVQIERQEYFSDLMKEL